MFSFDVSNIEDTYLRPCVCAEENKNLSKSFCYVEGTELDISRSDNKEELGENVWFQAKPPKLFNKELTPLITARQIQISRIIMSGTRGSSTLPDEDRPKEKVIVNMKKKKSAVKFLSTTEVCLD
ncbi:uncharacterized protein LOC108917140 [Anoplophora glabripennis]|uniref:uncharacterized protein LOC108917140 n=1 Tax=Anoplophora glabripennis TaxID=217634 RepID=UPI0008757517|nr:uncharacterized protein LOC108917140 [Anoplophora glabripennis]